MGMNTTIVVLNDALSEIENDPDFGRNLVTAICSLRHGKPQYVPAGGHCNAAIVIECHHANDNVLVEVGGNTGRVVQLTFRSTVI